jgi:hypothetical protein
MFDYGAVMAIHAVKNDFIPILDLFDDFLRNMQSFAAVLLLTVKGVPFPFSYERYFGPNCRR